jgi:ElaB/YqjD/DUF883 family membrane-anchored ribosome-binding protein
VDQADKGLSSLPQRILQTPESGKNALAQDQRMLKEKSKQAAKAAVNFARDNPWSTAGIVMGTATVLGLLLRSEFMT